MTRIKIAAANMRSKLLSAVSAGVLFSIALPLSASPWTPATSALPIPGPDIPAAAEVPGKDFSDHRDRDSMGVPDAEQNIAWDGTGGTRDSFDYKGSRLGFPDVAGQRQVDALGHGADALFDAVIGDHAALLFSVGETVPSGPGDANIYFEAAGGFGPPPVPSGVWASPLPEIDDEFIVGDVDGLELWGSDPDDDTDRYSIYGDPFVDLSGAGTGPVHKVAVWSYDAGAHTSTPAVLTTDLAAAIDLQFGGPGDGDFWSFLVETMDVDATMVHGERLMFSIAPITVPGPTGGPLATFDGGEIFVYDGPGTATYFLHHGGHDWDTAFDIVGTYGVLGVESENINALEAASVPEPST
ncbi:MAG: hypothetical protein ACR2NM_07795, partial [Bythopirellula sp.]